MAQKRHVILSVIVVACAMLFSAGRSEAQSPARPQPRPFSTIPAIAAQPPSHESEGPISRGPNVNITNQAGAQSETSVAVDPTNPSHLLESVNDLTNTAAVYESMDGGATWANSNLATNNSFCYDTWLGFNAGGDAFVSFECSDQRIAYKLAGTSTWVATRLTIAGSVPDRDMLAIDNAPTSPFSGSAYIGYDDNGANNTPYVLYSRDGKSGWNRSTAIPHPAPVIGVNVATASVGIVYACWEDYENGKLYCASSTNGGASFGSPVLVTTYRLNTSGFFVYIPPQNVRGIVPYPMIAVAQTGAAHAGRVYVSYTDKDTAGANTSIYLRYSDDGGTTWSAETKINDDQSGAYHFHHQIAVDSRGNVLVCFYDTRRDPSGKKTDRYAAISRDGGATFLPNKRYTSKQSDETVPSADVNQYGDYQGVYAGPDRAFYFSWTDSRSPGAKNEDMFGVNIKP